MKLILIRHGETVDNVAQVYAGVKDSALTVHGSLQADRLGQFFAQNGLRFTRIFSSDLQRAFKTAEAIRLEQCNKYEDEAAHRVHVEQRRILREQDFGFYEGKPFYAMSRGSSKSGKEKHRSQHVHDPNFRDVESKVAMDARMDEFIAGYLLPLIRERAGEKEVVALVSHGIILSHLWRCLLKLFGKGTVTLAPGLSVGNGGVTPLEYLGGWSNTGYLELDIQAPVESAPEKARVSDLKMVIKTVNGKEHLTGLKRTRGVGSSKHDEGQKKIEMFFKKAKVG